MLDSIFDSGAADATATATETNISFTNLLIMLGVSILLGVIMSFVYLKTNRSKTPSQSFAHTLVILPTVVSIIILMVGSNVARAFSLAGAFTIIRFRSQPGNPRDITYVLFCMAVGLACGMGYMLYAAIVAAIFSLVMIILELLNYGKPKESLKILKILIPENLDYDNVFDDIFKKYTHTKELKKLRTADLGSVYELNYEIEEKPDIDEKEFVDELRCRNGNLNISLLVKEESVEF